MRRILIPLLVCLLSINFVSAQAEPTAHKETVTRILDNAYNAGDVEPLDAGYAPDYVRHPGENDRLQVMGSILALRAAMPDLQLVTELVIAEAEWVAVRIRLTGTFQNELIFPNALPVPPNNQQIELVTNSVFRFNEAGLIAEEWNGFDNLSFLAQVGAVPTPVNEAQTALTISEILATGMEAQNEALITRYYEALNQGAFTFIEQNFRPEALTYNPFGSLDRAGSITDLTALRSALPDLNLTVTQLISEGNWTAALYTLRGTFTANFVTPGANPFPPTGKTLELVTVAFFRFDEAGLLAESWELYDSWNFLTQLGLLTVDDPTQ